jgi:hypothetical protein
MSKGPQLFKQRDLVRALKAAQAAGVVVGRFEIDKEGKIVVIAGKPEPECANREAKEWVTAQ